MKREKKKKSLHDRKPMNGTAICNICGNPFRHHSSYDRFCNSCKNHSKVFMFAEWMPETGVSL